MRQLVTRSIVVVAVAVLGACTVEDVEDPEFREAEDVDASEPPAGGGFVEECGCDPGFGPQEGEECFPRGPNDPPQTQSRAVTLENCGEVEVPWCDAQFGCEMIDTVCDCMEEWADIGTLAGWATWHCEPVDGTETIEPCETVRRWQPG